MAAVAPLDPASLTWSVRGIVPDARSTARQRLSCGPATTACRSTGAYLAIPCTWTRMYAALRTSPP